jgi:chaperonin GroEL
VIVAEDIDGEALTVCILNKLCGQLQVVAVKAPSFGDNRKSILGDLVILTGKTVFTDVPDIKLKHAALDMLGSTGSITITKEDAIVLNGQDSKDSTQPMFMIIHPASQVKFIFYVAIRNTNNIKQCTYLSSACPCKI